jgi:hypothetical protein
MLRLRGALSDDYLAAFLDGVIRETYLRLRLLDALKAHDLPALSGAGLDNALSALDKMCGDLERHLEEVKRLRSSARTPLELELIASLEKSIERTHLALRMLINALSEKLKHQ